ncbi:MAG: hypothetical protein LBN43_01255 [Oscillospiraceae bacterium]|nr:hypothetical protein [Oscillospiraceae bacterium]
MELELISTIMQTQLASKLGKSANSSDVSMSALNIGSSFGGSGGGSSEFSLLMSALMYKIAEQNSSQIPASVLSSLPFNSDFTLPFALSAAPTGIQYIAPAAEFDQSRYPLNVWQTCSPELAGTVAQRSPELLKAIVDQFKVERNNRYTPNRGGYTYCNIYVQDVMSALGVELPRLGAIATEEWLASQGVANGWYETDAKTAQMYANAGRPAITSMGSDGHLQVIVPEQNGAYDPSKGVAISQAGSQNHAYTHQTKMDKLRYWVHE